MVRLYCSNRRISSSLTDSEMGVASTLPFTFTSQVWTR
jgi:hypothetical protein